MSNFLIKPNSIKKSDILNKVFSLHPSEHKKIDIRNKNLKSISQLVNDEGVGEQINVDEYLNFNSNYTLVTISNMGKCIIDETQGERISPFIYKDSAKKLSKGDVLVSRNASLGKITLVNKDFNGILNGGISYLKFKEDKKYYAFAFFLLDYGADYLTVLTSGGGTQKNAKRQNLLDLKIPFPTSENHKTPVLIEKYVSLLTQNIIDKEEQIGKKLKQINELIEKELKSSFTKFSFTHPKKSTFTKNNFRLDTGLYKEEYKKIVDGIKKYENGYFSLASLKKHKWVSGSTPSALIETNLKTDKLWIAVADINYGLTYKRLKSFKIKDNINIIQNGDILITRKGATVGKMIIYFDTGYKETFVNEDLKVLRLDIPMYEKVFIGLFLNSKYGQVQMLSNGSKGTKQGLTNPNILNVVIPKFPDAIKKQIAVLYHNEIKKEELNDLDSYLETEKNRNSKIGIAQLNLESFELIEKLDSVIHKIITNEPITI